MTIDLGFAVMTLPSGREVALVDVPAHYRFFKNMLAGVSSVDACLFVVDAGEGWMAQSEEHLRILELLGISRGVLVLTKVGSVDQDLRELAALDVAEHVQGTFLAYAEVVAVDAMDGIGLDMLRAALDRLTDQTPASIDRHRAKSPRGSVSGRPIMWRRISNCQVKALHRFVNNSRRFATKWNPTVGTGRWPRGTANEDLSTRREPQLTN